VCVGVYFDRPALNSIGSLAPCARGLSCMFRYQMHRPSVAILQKRDAKRTDMKLNGRKNDRQPDCLLCAFRGD
jgi:hypothetical protein